MQYQSVLLFLCFAINLSCVATKAPSSRTLSGPDELIPSPPTCPAGEANYLMLKKSSFPIDQEALAKNLLPKLAPPFKMLDPDAEKNVRVTVCISFPQGVPQFDLKEILVVKDAYVASYKPYWKPALVEHLDEALEGNPARLLLRISDNQTGVEIRGHTLESRSIVSAVEVIESEDKIYYAAANTYAGTLEFGNPFIPRPKGDDLRCSETSGPKSFQVENVFELGTAKLFVSGCSSQGAGNSSVYDYFSVDVLDSSTDIPLEFRGKRTKFAGPDLVVTHTESHHNWCDNIFISIPKMNVKYASVRQSRADFQPILVEGKELKGTAVNYNGVWKILSIMPGICQ